GTEIKAESTVSPVSINLSELDSGSWVIFELPGFTTAHSSTKVDSLAALRSASATSYYNGEGELWVKIVSAGGPVGRGGRGGGGGGPVHVSKYAEPCWISKSPRRRPGAFFSRSLSGNRDIVRGHKPRVLVDTAGI